MMLNDALDPEVRLDINRTEDPAIVEVRAIDGLRSVTVDVSLDDLRAALHAVTPLGV